MLDLLNELKRLDEAATPKPWKDWPIDKAMPDDVRVCQEETGNCICCLALMGDADETGTWTEDTVARWKADAALIATVRNALPELIAKLELLTSEHEAALRMIRSPASQGPTMVGVSRQVYEDWKMAVHAVEGLDVAKKEQ